MSVNPSMPQEINNSTIQLRVLELEASFAKKHEELSKTVESLKKNIDYLLKAFGNLSKHHVEVKTKIVKKLCFRIVINSFLS
jgi:hypothetical protein